MLGEPNRRSYTINAPVARRASTWQHVAHAASNAGAHAQALCAPQIFVIALFALPQKLQSFKNRWLCGARFSYTTACMMAKYKIQNTPTNRHVSFKIIPGYHVQKKDCEGKKHMGYSMRKPINLCKIN